MYKRSWTFCVLALLCVLVGCVEETPVEEYGSDYTIYLSNEELTGHVPVRVDLTAGNLEGRIQEILELLKNGFDNDALITTIPSDVRIQKVSVSDTKVTIHFSKEYNDMNSPITEIICRSSVVKSLTELSQIDYVEIKVEGIPLKDSEGNIIGPMTNQDIIMDIQEETNGGEEVTVVVYFTDESGRNLVAEQQTIKIDASKGYEETILGLLVEGPKERGHYATIPEGTIVKDVYTSDGICYIDFNEAFITTHLGGSASESLTIYSIVNSLAERPNITKVQFLVEGEIKETFKGHLEFDVTFEPDWDLIIKE